MFAFPSHKKQSPREVLKAIPRGKWKTIRWKCRECGYFWVVENKRVQKFCQRCEHENIEVFDWW